MLNLIVSTIKSIIDLLHKRDENKKIRVETEIKQIELDEKISPIVKATNDDIRIEVVK